MSLITTLKQYRGYFGPVLPASIQWGQAVVLDMNNPYWQDAASCSLEELISRTSELLLSHQAVLAIGQYAEDRRYLYKRSELFYQDNDYRSVHLGVDLVMATTCPIYTPYPAVVHSFADNNNPGDYGPTIILKHELGECCFYSLYGHLARRSLESIYQGQSLGKGECFAYLGEPSENGGWPVHLHFQIIDDIGEWYGGYPGVVQPHAQQAWLANCPDPNLILNISAASL